MKKILLFMLIVLSTIILTSCHNKTNPTLKFSDTDSLNDEFIVGDSSSIDSTILANADEIINLYKGDFKGTKDEFSDNTWVEPLNKPKDLESNIMICYFTINNLGQPCDFRFEFRYCAKKLLGIKSLTFNFDNELYYKLSPINFEFDAVELQFVEWCDANVSNNNNNGLTEDFLKLFLQAKSVKVKAEGRQYYDAREISAEEIKYIKECYEYYLALGGKF